MSSQSGDYVPSSPSSSAEAVRQAVRNVFTSRPKSTRRSKSEPLDIRLLQHAEEYWNSIGPEEREGFLKISISDLKEHFSKSNEYGTLLRALSHVQEHRAFNIHVCCECGETFSDSDLFLDHIRGDHMKRLPPNLLSELPEQVDKDMAEIIINGEWKPVTIEVDGEESKDRERESVSLVHKRADHIRRIQKMFQWLSENGCLSYSHLKEVMRFTKNELLELPSSSQSLSGAFSLLPKCICSLDSDQLDSLSTFLEELENSCQGAEDMDCPPDETEDEKKVFPIEKTLSWDSTKLLLNKSYILAERQFFESHDNSGESEAIFLSLFSDHDLEDRIFSMKLSNGKKLLQLYERKLSQLQTDCIEKRRLSSYKGILADIEKSIQEEGKKRESFPEYPFVSYKSIVCKRLRKNHSVTKAKENIPSKIEVLLDILKEARNCYCDYFDCDHMSIGITDPAIAWNSVDLSDKIIACAIERIKNGITLKICKNDARILQTMTRKGLYEIKLGRILAVDCRLSLVPFMKIFMRSQLEVLGVNHAYKKANAAAVALLIEEASEKKDNVKESSKKPEATQGKTKNKKKKKKRQQQSEGIKACGVNEDSPEKEEKISTDKTVDTETGAHELENPNEELYNQPSIEQMGPLIREQKDLEEIQIKFHGNSLDGQNSVNEGESTQSFGLEAQSGQDDRPSEHSQSNGKQKISPFSLDNLKFGSLRWSDVVAKGKKPR